MRVGICGLGLMGGSFALALKNNPDIHGIFGFDTNPIHCEEALKLGIVEAIFDLNDIVSFDVIILAMPVNAITKFLQECPPLSLHTTLIDLGSTKEGILTSVPARLRKNFVASHPMTGTEFSGPTAAFSSLYKDKVVVLCDIEESGTFQAGIAIKLFEFLGMRIIHMKAKDHDRHAAFISHLPHIISYALANTVLGQEDKNAILALAAGGFKDMSRLAKSSPTMWNDIFSQNKENLLSSMTIFMEQLSHAYTMVEHNEKEPLFEWMKEANFLHKIM